MLKLMGKKIFTILTLLNFAYLNLCFSFLFVRHGINFIFNIINRILFIISRFRWKFQCLSFSQWDANVKLVSVLVVGQ